MGQPIEVETVRLGDVLILDTDRTITGQDGESYASHDSAREDGNLSAQLARQLFDTGDDVSHVYLFSNTISVRREGGWTDEASAAAVDVVRNFFVFYDENREVTA